MSYHLESSEKQVLQVAISYGRTHFLPYTQQWEEAQSFPLEAFRQAGQDGYLGINIAENFGGKKRTFLEAALIYQGFSRSNFPLTLGLECHNNMAYEMSIFSSSDDVKALIPGMLSGKELLAFGLTEPGAGSDPNSMKAYARKTEGGYILNGYKTWVTNGCEATLFDVTVKLGSPDAREMVTFLVDIPSKGLEVVGKTETMAGNVISKAKIRMSECFVPEARLVSANGYKDAMFSVLIARIFTPAMAIGLCEEAIEKTAEYLASRKQFGKPLLVHQTLQWKLGELQAKVEAGKHLVYHTASLMDAGMLPKHEAALSKLYCAELAMEVTTACCQMFGAEGYRKGNVLERLFREAKMISRIYGTSEVQRLLLGGDLLKRYITPDNNKNGGLV